MKRTLFLISIVFILIAVSVTLAQKATGRRYILLPDRPPLPFSDGVLAGNTLYLSGRLGIDPKTGKVPENLDEEIRNILDGMKATLEQAGMKMEKALSNYKNIAKL